MIPSYRNIHYVVRTNTEINAWQFIKDIPIKTLYAVEDYVPSVVEQIVEDNISNIVMAALQNDSGTD